MKAKVLLPILFMSGSLFFATGATGTSIQATWDQRMDMAVKSLQQERANEDIEFTFYYPEVGESEDYHKLTLPEGFCVPGELALEMGKVIIERVFGWNASVKYRYFLYEYEENQCYIIERRGPYVEGALDGGSENVAISSVDGRILSIWEDL